MAIIIKAPEENYSLEAHSADFKLFLAGGITNCEDWQTEMEEHLKGMLNLVIYNPRRDNFPMDDPSAAESQIVWEYRKLQECNMLIFWFSKETLCPITLYELGKWGNSDPSKWLVIGIDPEYKRKADVEIQTALSRPDVQIVDSVELLAEQVKIAIEGSNA